MASILSSLGTTEIPRLRIGVGRGEGDGLAESSARDVLRARAREEEPARVHASDGQFMKRSLTKAAPMAGYRLPSSRLRSGSDATTGSPIRRSSAAW